jgi:hypothetical protein
MQGWAMVDNVGDEDWHNVQLVLVAGLPISFTHDLYNPRYKKRQEIKVQESEAYAPPQLESAIRQQYESDDEDDDDDEDGMYLDDFTVPAQTMMNKSLPRMAQASAFAIDALHSLPSISSTNERSLAREKSAQNVQVRNVEAGDLFNYEIDHPVDVKRNGAALVPFYQGRVECRKIALYNQSIREKVRYTLMNSYHRIQ